MAQALLIYHVLPICQFYNSLSLQPPQGLKRKAVATGKFLRSFFQKATRRRHG